MTNLGGRNKLISTHSGESRLVVRRAPAPTALSFNKQECRG